MRELDLEEKAQGQEKRRKPKPVVVGVLTKALRIFELLQGVPSGVSLKEISERTGIHTSTAYRLLAHLEREGYLLRDGAGNYYFGMKLLLLGGSVNRHAALRETAGSILRELSKSTGETVNLAVLDNNAVLYLDVVESHHVFRLVSSIGMRRPLYSTALGKALTAFLPAEELERVLASLDFESWTPQTITSLAEFRRELHIVRQQAFAVDDEEAVLGARCIGAPILDFKQAAVAAVSVAGPATRVTQEKIPIFAAAVTDACRVISARMGLLQSGAPNAPPLVHSAPSGA